MKNRQLWQNIMTYGDFDRMPVIHWAGWPETRQIWLEEGMPADVDEHDYFKAVNQWHTLALNLDLYPPFDIETIEETEQYRIFRDESGVLQKDWKHNSCIPHFVDFTFKQAKDWDEYKKRLQPDPGRIPEGLVEQIAQAEASETAICIWCGSLMGWIRNWMGIENMSYLMFDRRDVYADMINTLSNLACWGIDQIVPKMSTVPDMGHCWEDICGKTGPLVSPGIFKECVAPGYLKIRNKPTILNLKHLNLFRI